MNRFLPSARIANVLIIMLCLYECFSFYRTGWQQGYECAVAVQMQTQTQQRLFTVQHVEGKHK